MCVNKMARRIDIDLRIAAAAARQPGKGYKAISKLYEVHQSTARKNNYKWNSCLSSQEGSLQVHIKGRLCMSKVTAKQAWPHG